MKNLNYYVEVLHDFASHFKFNTKLKFNPNEYVIASDSIGKETTKELKEQAEYYSKLINKMSEFISENEDIKSIICDNVSNEQCESFEFCSKCIIAYFKNQIKEENS